MQQIAGYVVVRKIASGGMGDVYLAKSPEGKEVALKVLPPDTVAPSEQKHFANEARLTALLRHDNIVPLLDYGTGYIALEYVAGVDLERVIGGELPLHPAAKAYIARELLSALAYAHDATGPNGERLDIVHRDVTPSNVLCAYDGRVKLSDFGIAKATLRDETRTATGKIKGKTSYLAPEQVLNEPLTPAVDVFAATVLLVELFTGKHPFSVENPYHTMQRIVHRPVPTSLLQAEGISDALVAVLAKGLQRTVSARYQNGRELLDAFLAACPADMAEGRAQLVRRIRPRRKRPVVPVAVGAATCAAIVFVSWPQKQPPTAPPVIVTAPTEVSAPVSATAPAEVSVPAPAPPVVKPRPRPTPPSTSPPAVVEDGTLRVLVRPWARVFVDGEPRGTTPMPAMALAAGSHRVRLSNDELGVERERVVEIKPSKETRIEEVWTAP